MMEQTSERLLLLTLHNQNAARRTVCVCVYWGRQEQSWGHPTAAAAVG